MSVVNQARISSLSFKCFIKHHFQVIGHLTAHGVTNDALFMKTLVHISFFLLPNFDLGKLNHVCMYVCMYVCKHHEIYPQQTRLELSYEKITACLAGISVDESKVLDCHANLLVI